MTCRRRRFQYFGDLATGQWVASSCKPCHRALTCRGEDNVSTALSRVRPSPAVLKSSRVEVARFPLKHLKRGGRRPWRKARDPYRRQQIWCQALLPPTFLLRHHLTAARKAALDQQESTTLSLAMLTVTKLFLRMQPCQLRT